MTRACNGAQSWQQISIALEGFEASFFGVGAKRCHGAGEEAFHLLRGLVHVFLGQPVVSVSLVDTNDGIGENNALAVRQTTDVVCMQVGEIDFVDLLGFISGCNEVGNELSARGTK